MIKDVEKTIEKLQKTSQYPKAIFRRSICSWDEIYQGLRTYPAYYIYTNSRYKKRQKQLVQCKKKEDKKRRKRIVVDDMRELGPPLKIRPEYACPHRKLIVTTFNGLIGIGSTMRTKVMVCPMCGIQIKIYRNHGNCGIRMNSECLLAVSFKTAEQLSQFIEKNKRIDRHFGLLTKDVYVFGYDWGGGISSDGKTALYHCIPQNSFEPYLKHICENNTDIVVEYFEQDYVCGNKIIGYGDGNGYTQTTSEDSMENFYNTMEKKYGTFEEQPSPPPERLRYSDDNE